MVIKFSKKNERGEKMTRRLYALTLILCCFTAFCLGYFVRGFATLYRHKVPSVLANVYLTVESPTGIYDLLESNIVTDIGENATRYGVCGVAVNVNYIAIGNSTIDKTKTKLDVEYIRLPATSRVFWVYNGDYAFNITRKFTLTETVTLNAAAVHWSGTANAQDAFAIAPFTQVTTFHNGWNLTVTWVFIFDAN